MYASVPVFLTVNSYYMYASVALLLLYGSELELK